MRRAIRTLGATLATAPIFILALAGGILLHLDLPLTRRVIVARVNGLLAASFAGRVTIVRLARLGPRRIGGFDATVADPEGRNVLRVVGASARLCPVALLQSLLGQRAIVARASSLSAARVEVDLGAERDGALRLAAAFAPAAGPAPSSKARPLRLELPRIEVAHTLVHGRLGHRPEAVDANIDALDAAAALTPEGIDVGVASAVVAAADLPARGVTTRGAVAGHFTRRSGPDGQLEARARWKGYVGGVAETAAVAYGKGRVDVAVDVPQARPADVVALWPSWPVTAPAAVHLEAHGELPLVTLRAQAAVGGGTVVIAGPVQIGAPVRASLHLQAAAVDAHALSERAPPTRVSGQGEALVTLSGARAGASATIETQDSTWRDARLPAVTLVGRVTFDPARATTVAGHLDAFVHEPGAPLRASLDLATVGRSLRVGFDATAEAPSLEAMPRLGGQVRGRASLRARGTFDSETDRLDARVHASAKGLGVGAAGVGSATFDARLTGPVETPRLDASLDARELAAGPFRLAAVHAEAHGPPLHAPVSVGLGAEDVDARASADVSLGDGVTLRHLRVAIDSKGRRVRGEASLVAVSPSELRVDDATLEGLGEPVRGAVRVSPGEVRLQARSRRVDLASVAAFARLAHPAFGQASFDIDAAFQRAGALGRLRVDVSRGGYGGLRGLQAHVDASLEGRRVRGRVRADLPGVGLLDLQTAALHVGGTAPLDASFWRRAWGQADVVAHIDLGRLAAEMQPGAKLPVAGVLDVKGQLGRDSADDRTPAVDLVATTTGLTLSEPDSAGRARVARVDAAAHLNVDGADGDTTLDARLTDAGGPLAVVTCSSDEVPYAGLFDPQKRLRDVLEATPLRAEVSLPPRDIDSWPLAFGGALVHGKLGAKVDWSGSVLSPDVTLIATLGQARTAESLLGAPLRLDLAAHYDGAHAEATLRAASPRSGSLLELSANLDARAADLLGHSTRPAAWSGSAHAKLTDFPLGALGLFDQREVRGRASGEMTVTGLHDDARASASLSLRGLVVGGVACPSAEARAAIDGRAFDASIRVDQSDGGFVQARTHAGAHWGKALVPSLDAAQPTTASLSARGARAALLLPFVSGTFDQLDGRIDASAQMIADPTTRTIRPGGTVTLADGAFALSAAGGEFRDAAGTLSLSPDGVVRLENVRARGGSGRLLAAATARFHGFALDGARARIVIPHASPLPLVLQGVDMGTVSGRFGVAVESVGHGGGLDVDVDAPTVHVALSASPPHDVQALGPLPGVEIGVERGADFIPEPREDGGEKPPAASRPAPPLRLTVHLGRDVEVRRGTSLSVRLEGDPKVVVTSQVLASGQIRVVRGTVDVQGKPFTVENGTITFVGPDPSNPQVKLTATWTAPDGTRVYADFVGPLKTGKVTLRSEPARSRSEILALVLFGTTDAQAATPTASSEGTTAVGAAGSAATQPINRALGGVNRMLDNLGMGGGISTKVDTSQATPRPEVELRIARDISLQVAWVLGVPPPGTNPDTTLVTLSWHFLRRWSLRTTVGSAGTSILDLVWQHRY